MKTKFKRNETMNPEFVPPTGWVSYNPVTLTESVGLDRVNDPVDILFKPYPGNCRSENEIRVIAPDGVTEVPSQVYDVVRDPGTGCIASCRVVFLANCPAYGSVTYYIIYNNHAATAPEYDGLRLITEAPGDTYSIKIHQAGVDYNYLHLFLKNMVDLWAGGNKVAPSVNVLLWSQLNLGTGWSDAKGVFWMGAGKTLSVLNSGPVFVDLNYTEAYGADFYGTVFDHDVSATKLLRVYYQPDLNLLMRYHQTLNIKTNLANYTIQMPVYIDFKLSNSINQPIYKYLTWKNTVGVVKTVLTEEPPFSDEIWSPANPVGWWNLNGSRPDSADKPAANIGLIPTHCEGTIAGSPAPNYTVTFNHTEPIGMRNSQWLKGTYNGRPGDTIETQGYIITITPVDQNIAPIMENKALRLRNPLKSSIGLA